MSVTHAVDCTVSAMLAVTRVWETRSARYAMPDTRLQQLRLTAFSHRATLLVSLAPDRQAHIALHVLLRELWKARNV